MGKWKNYGKIADHFCQRLIQSGFEGSEGEAKKVGVAILSLAESSDDRVAISIENLLKLKTKLNGELARKTERFILENRRKGKEMFAEISQGEAVNVKELIIDKGLYLHLRLRNGLRHPIKP